MVQSTLVSGGSITYQYADLKQRYFRLRKAVHRQRIHVAECELSLSEELAKKTYGYDFLEREKARKVSEARTTLTEADKYLWELTHAMWSARTEKDCFRRDHRKELQLPKVTKRDNESRMAMTSYRHEIRAELIDRNIRKDGRQHRDREDSLTYAQCYASRRARQRRNKRTFKVNDRLSDSILTQFKTTAS